MAAPVLNPPTPYTTLIPGGFFPGKMIRVQGFVPMHAQRFDINLQTGGGGEIAGEDVGLHASVRLTEGYIARNSFQGGCWQEELGDGGLPIQLGQRFEFLLLCESYEYKIAVNGQHFCGFPMRVPYNRITHLLVEGDVQVEMIGWEGSSASAPPMNGPPQYGAPVPPPQYTPQQQTFVQQPPPPPGAMPNMAGIHPSSLSYGPNAGLYPNLHVGPHPGGVMPPQQMPQPSPGHKPFPTHPPSQMPNHPPFPTQHHAGVDPHKPFPSQTPHVPFPNHSNPHQPFASHNDHLSEKAKRKIAKAEHKAEKMVHKAQRRAEKKAAKAERRAMKKHGVPVGKVVGTGLGVAGIAGAATLAYAASAPSRRSSSSSTSSTSSSD